ncbi:hypothetical protein DYB32_008587, partial [Aphanomyces invadans]
SIVASAAKKRAKARGRRRSLRRVELAKFALGDFVLAARAVQHPSKLSLRWSGPYRVVKVLSDYLMEMQQLVPPFDTSLHQACRLKMYCEGGRDVDEDLKTQIAFGDEGFNVDELRGIRQVDGEWQVLQ